MTPRLLVLVLALAVTGLAGCLSKPYPVKKTFSIDAPRPGGPRTSPLPITLQVRGFTSAPQFEGKSFVYRTTDLTYEVDFYNEFLSAPRALITDEARQWLRGSGLCRAVLEPTSKAEATHALEAHVAARYADFRDQSAPKAVLGLQFFLLQMQGTSPVVVFQKSYRQEIPMDARTAVAAAQGWSTALKQILTALEEDLSKAGLPRGR